MKKDEFLKKIVEKTGSTKKEAEEFLAAFEDVVMEDVFAAEDSIRLSIGTFSGFTKETPARKGRNPKTGEALDIPAKTIKGYPKFKPSKAAKE